MVDLDRVRKRIEGLREEMIALQADLTAIPALAPENGGKGEGEKAERLRAFLNGLKDLEVMDVHAPDSRVPGGYRPNLIVRWPVGMTGASTWVLTHMDVVPPGERSLWVKDPFRLWLEEGKIHGRGVEDNQQAMVASLFALKALQEERLHPPRAVSLALLADEETGSRYGLRHVLEQRPNLFRPSDLILVPDFGDPRGDQIEIAEKGIFWLRIRVRGRQCHASRPQDGINTLRAASHLVVRLDSLPARFSRRDDLFDPPVSTFEPTKKEANVPNINTIPGEDVLYLDCRILPGYELPEVEQAIREIASQIESELGVTIQLDPLQEDAAATPTSPDAPVVCLARQAIREIYGRDPKLVGIGGGTLAAILRREGHQVAAFSRIDRTAHQPNEYCRIENMVGDCQVLAYCFLRSP